MSLINDALRRANQSKKKQSSGASDDVPMQPNPPPVKSRAPSFAPMLSIPIVVALFVASFFLFKSWKTNFKTIAQREKASLVQITPPKTPASTGIAQSLPVAVPAENLVAVETTPIPSNPELVEPKKLSTTNVDEQSEPVPATPPALKLQGIFYRLSHPTALINGKTLAVGEMVSGARVVKIERQEVTLDRDGQKIVLTLH